MIHKGVPRRAKNSLSRKKFTDRLNKDLPIFVAYGREKNGVSRYDDCRDLYWRAWRYPNPRSTGAEFIHVTKHYPDWTYANATHSLRDMNVVRNKYNANFVFRTRWAAEQYMRDAV